MGTADPGILIANPASAGKAFSSGIILKCRRASAVARIFNVNFKQKSHVSFRIKHYGPYAQA